MTTPSKPRKRKTAPNGGTPTTSAPLGMASFMTRQRANEGQRLPLHTAEGVLTKHFLLVRGQDSDEAQRAMNQQVRNVAEVSQLPEDERADAAIDGICRLLAVLVKDWSFSDPELMPEGEALPCTFDNVVAFLREAPQIREQIDTLASKRGVFFRMQSAGLNSTPKSSLT